MKSTFSIIFYLKRQVVKKDGTVPVMEINTKTYIRLPNKSLKTIS